MSEVMKALHQSEQAYQAQSTQQIQRIEYNKQTQHSINKWLIVLLTVLPILIVLGYWLYIQKSSAPIEISTIQSSLESSQNFIDDVEIDKAANAHLLPYPKVVADKVLPELKPLPKVLKPLPTTRPESSPKVTSSTSNSGTIIKTDQVNLDAPNNDWGVNELDLSDIPPELAERFKAALSSQSAKDKKPTTDTLAVPDGTINLVGNEPQYYNVLPKMNFETHMYASSQEKRWVKVNGNELHEGDWIIPDSVRLEKILPGSTVILFNRQLIQVPALYEWHG